MMFQTKSFHIKNLHASSIYYVFYLFSYLRMHLINLLNYCINNYNVYFYNATHDLFTAGYYLMFMISF